MRVCKGGRYVAGGAYDVEMATSAEQRGWVRGVKIRYTWYDRMRTGMLTGVTLVHRQA